METQNFTTTTGYKPFESSRDAMLSLAEINQPTEVGDYIFRLNQSLYSGLITEKQHTLLFGDLMLLMSRYGFQLFDL